MIIKMRGITPILFCLGALVGTTPSLARANYGCRTVHGRIQIWNGTPDVRISVLGSKRILGVDGPNGEAFELLPPKVARFWESKGNPMDHALIGDFRVCALTPERPGWMQFVTVKSGKNLRFAW